MFQLLTHVSRRVSLDWSCLRYICQAALAVSTNFQNIQVQHIKSFEMSGEELSFSRAGILKSMGL